jgi:hypothetical protein
MTRIRSRGAIRLAAAAVLLAVGPVPAAEDSAPGAAFSAADRPGSDAALGLISPMFGYNRDVLKQRDLTGQIRTATKTAPEYGLFAMAAHPRVVVNDFLFFTEAAGDTDVAGNFFHVNLYGDPEAAVTWNVGAGHLYHKIDPPNEDIEVNVPLVKAGPLLRARRWGLALNPYLGYAWERVDTRHADVDNDSMLYGVTLDWRWRMLSLNVKYYYQDSRDTDEGYNTVHARFGVGAGRRWGAVARLDYMEHVTTDDTSVLIGPVFVF